MRLTEEQSKRYGEKKKELEAQFTELQFKNYRIHYVKNEKDADVVVSKNHVETDFLAVGVACLKKTLLGKDVDEVKVYNKEMLSTDYSALAIRCCPELAENFLTRNALYYVEQDISGIVYKTFKEKSVSTSPSGLIVYNTITAQLLHGDEIPEGNEYLQFEYFDDTISAQKNAYELIKLIFIASTLGAMFDLFG